MTRNAKLQLTPVTLSLPCNELNRLWPQLSLWGPEEVVRLHLKGKEIGTGVGRC